MSDLTVKLHVRSDRPAREVADVVVDLLKDLYGGYLGDESDWGTIEPLGAIVPGGSLRTVEEVRAYCARALANEAAGKRQAAQETDPARRLYAEGVNDGLKACVERVLAYIDGSGG